MKQTNPIPDTINIFDFDNTIYRGDSTADFYLFCVRRKPRLLIYLPCQLWHTLRYFLKLEKRGAFKGHFFIFIRGLKDIETMVERFWQSHFKNIKPWYLEMEHSHDVIISASPHFLLYPAFQKLGAHSLIATEVDLQTGQLIGENCYGEEKVVRLRQLFAEANIERAYTDSLVDLPLLALAKEPYLVKGDRVKPYK